MKTFAVLSVMTLSLCQILFAAVAAMNLTLELLPNPDSIYLGDEAFFYCDIKPEYLRNYYTVVWLRDGVELNRNTTTALFDRRTLLFTYVLKSNIGNYSCQITTYNNVTFKSQTVPLKATKRPAGLQRPEYTELRLYLSNRYQSPIDIVEGDFVKLICDIQPSSATILGVSWFHNDWEINEKDTDGIFEDHHQTLVFKNIKKSAAGKYECWADTKIGFLYARELHLIIENGPVQEPQILSTIPYSVQKYTVPDN